MPTCLKLFRSLGVFFSSFLFPPSLSFSPLTVGAVCGRRGVGWISRKGGWDAQTEGEKRGGTKQSHIVEDGHGRQRGVGLDCKRGGVVGLGGQGDRGRKGVNRDEGPRRDSPPPYLMGSRSPQGY